MVSRREKVRRSLYRMKEQIFLRQMSIMKNTESHLFGTRMMQNVMTAHKSESSVYDNYAGILERAKQDDLVPGESFYFDHSLDNIKPKNKKNNVVRDKKIGKKHASSTGSSDYYKKRKQRHTLHNLAKKKSDRVKSLIDKQRGYMSRTPSVESSTTVQNSVQDVTTVQNVVQIGVQKERGGSLLRTPKPSNKILEISFSGQTPLARSTPAVQRSRKINDAPEVADISSIEFDSSMDVDDVKPPQPSQSVHGMRSRSSVTSGATPSEEKSLQSSRTQKNRISEAKTATGMKILPVGNNSSLEKTLYVERTPSEGKTLRSRLSSVKEVEASQHESHEKVLKSGVTPSRGRGRPPKQVSSINPSMGAKPSVRVSLEAKVPLKEPTTSKPSRRSLRSEDAVVKKEDCLQTDDVHSSTGKTSVSPRNLFESFSPEKNEKKEAPKKLEKKSSENDVSSSTDVEPSRRTSLRSSKSRLSLFDAILKPEESSQQTPPLNNSSKDRIPSKADILHTLSPKCVTTSPILHSPDSKINKSSTSSLILPRHICDRVSDRLTRLKNKSRRIVTTDVETDLKYGVQENGADVENMLSGNRNKCEENKRTDARPLRGLNNVNEDLSNSTTNSRNGSPILLDRQPSVVLTPLTIETKKSKLSLRIKRTSPEVCIVSETRPEWTKHEASPDKSEDLSLSSFNTNNRKEKQDSTPKRVLRRSLRSDAQLTPSDASKNCNDDSDCVSVHSTNSSVGSRYSRRSRLSDH